MTKMMLRFDQVYISSGNDYFTQLKMDRNTLTLNQPFEFYRTIDHTMRYVDCFNTAMLN